MSIKSTWLIFFCTVAAGFGAMAKQFRVVNSSIDDPEVGKIENLLILHEHQQFSLRPPVNTLVGVDEAKSTVSFSIPEKVSMQVQITSDYPNGLPGKDVLTQKVIRLYEGSAVLRSSVCPSGIESGWLVDVKRVFNADVSVITRHAFIPIPGGTAEFIFSTESSAFEGWRGTFGSLLNSFQMKTPINTDLTEQPKLPQ